MAREFKWHPKEFLHPHGSNPYVPPGHILVDEDQVEFARELYEAFWNAVVRPELDVYQREDYFSPLRRYK